MKAPVKWLLDYTDLKITTDEQIHELASEMTLSGSKVESVDKLESEIKRVVVSKCVECKRHENSDHMFVCQMDTGTENGGITQIVTGAQNIRVGAYVPVALDNSVIAGGKEIKSGKLRGEVSNGMMCSFEEIGLDYKNYEGGINDGIMVIQDLKMFADYTEEQLEALVGQNIMSVFGLVYDDTVIDFEITSNRVDCFSIIGLAREAAITMKGKFALPDVNVKEEGAGNASDYVSVNVEAKDLCPAYFARAVTDVKIAPSPKWMRDRLEAAGVRSINNIVDITNYVMLEYGQPMHAFDRRTIRGGKITVRRAGEGEVIRTLDGQDRVMNKDMLVIADDEGSIGIAGVMGGENSEIREDTTELVFEAAVFDGVTVRRGAKSVGLRTEASSRFEKGLDVVTCAQALERAAFLVELLGAGKVQKGIVSDGVAEAKERVIRFIPENINKFIGIDASAETMVDILNQLECKVDLEGQTVIPPSFRPDLICEADIAEEIARFYGYNNIKSSLLAACEMTLGQRTKLQRIRDVIRHNASAMGYHEMLTYSFESPSVYDKLRLPEDDALRNSVKITNPLGEDYSVMRTSMLPTLLKTLSYNYAQRTAVAKLFEVAFVYIKDEDVEKLPEHREQLCMACYGNTDFFALKGEIEVILDTLKIKDAEFEPVCDNPSMHPGRCAKLVVKGKDVGFFGQVHPIVAENFECPVESYVAIIDLKPLVDNCVEIPKSKELPKFPAVTRDLAVVVDKGVPAGHVEKIIRQRGGKLLESCALFDCYEGAQLPEGKKSLAYSLFFRTPDGTLTDEDVSKPMKKILNGLETMLGAELR